MLLDLALGTRSLSVSLPDDTVDAVLYPRPPADIPPPGTLLTNALENPIGTPKLRDIVKPGEKIAIITSDITRPMPSKVVLPFILDELGQAGVSDSDITIYFGLGIHRGHTTEEMKKLVGDEIFSRIRCQDSDPNQTVRLGYTKLNNTPVDVYDAVHQADRRICLGNIELHYIAGYSGGGKAIMPGVSSRHTIQANHSLMTRDDARSGINNNLLRRDMEEAAGMVGIDFILNVILDEKKNILHAVAGHYVQAQREGVKHIDAIYKAPIARQADIVISSAGGNPKDLNLYQSQKALDNANFAVRDGGIIILIASCREGLGEDVFEQWMVEHERSRDMLDKIAQNFVLGGHKAAAIAMVLERAKVFLVSDLDPEFVRTIFFHPYPDVDSAVNAAMAELGADSRILVMPFGGSTLPFVCPQ